jgi:hypothetical protein
MICETQLTLDQAVARRDVALDRVERNAEEFFAEFTRKAQGFVLEYLRRKGDASGEAITNACRQAGIVPHDDRAFGPVYLALSRARKIEKAGFCARTKGHGTSGGIVWRLAA